MQTTTLIKEHRCNVKHSKFNSASFWGFITVSESRIFLGGNMLIQGIGCIFLKEFKESTSPIL